MNIVLCYPYARMALLTIFEDLANKEKQIKEWNELTSDQNYWYNLCYFVIDDMYFDSCSSGLLNRGVTGKVGWYTYDEEEINILTDFMIFLDKLVEEIGSNQPDEVYLDHPQWPLVWEWAEKIVELMERKNVEYDFEVSKKVIELYPELLDKAGYGKDQAVRDELERLGYRLLIPRNLSQSSDTEPNVTR